MFWEKCHYRRQWSAKLLDPHHLPSHYARTARATVVRCLSDAMLLGLGLSFLAAGCVRVPLYTYRNAELEWRSSSSLPDAAAGSLSVEDVRSGQLIMRSDSESDGWNIWAGGSAKPFVGLAISGGGSRAANFGAAVLQELKAIGLLHDIKAISSVSGGSIPAAYYALHLLETEHGWNKMRQRMRRNFLRAWALRAFEPLTIARKLFTDYDRADLLASVFDRVLFKSATFRSLPSNAPELLINATKQTSDGDLFTFDRIHFAGIRSRLDTYPISQAVAASGAFPGLFDNVTLRSYAARPFTREDVVDVKGLAARIRDEDSPLLRHLRNIAGPGESTGDVRAEVVEFLERLLADRYGRPLFEASAFAGVLLRPETVAEIRDPNVLNREHGRRMLIEDAFSGQVRKSRVQYVHLFDGGGADNLGIRALLESAKRYFASEEREGRSVDGCLLIIADAHVQSAESDSERRDTRHWYDIAVNFNALAAVDALLRTRRTVQLQPYGLGDGRGGIQKHKVGNLSCGIWHVSFGRLGAVAEENRKAMARTHGLDMKGSLLSEEYHRMLFRVIGGIGTSYKLRDDRGCSPKQLQTALYDSARILVREDAILQSRALAHLGRERLEKYVSFLYRAQSGAGAGGEEDGCPASLGGAAEELSAK